MNSENISTFSCQYCRHYRSSNRGEEFCKLLFVPVQGHLTGCSFYVKQNLHTSTYYGYPYTHPMVHKLGNNLLTQEQCSH